MTARLGRWLNSLEALEQRIARTPTVRRYGRLTRATGLVLEATGLQLPLGATCLIERDGGGGVQEVESEVVGFNDQRLYLMPLEEVEGIVPGRGFTPAARRTASTLVNNCRWARRCWDACSTAAPGRLTACPRRKPAIARR